MTWLTVVLAVGTVLRFTRLFSKDKILEPAREYIDARAQAAEAGRLDRQWEQDPVTLKWRPPHGLTGLRLFFERKWTGFWPWLDDLIGCPWCVSVYVSLPVAIVAVWWGDNRLILAGLLACTASWVAGIVQQHTEAE